MSPASKPAACPCPSVLAVVSFVTYSTGAAREAHGLTKAPGDPGGLQGGPGTGRGQLPERHLPSAALQRLGS